MIKKIFFTFILILSIASLKADIKQDIDSAEIYYSNKQYYEASQKYEAVISANMESADLHFNLGNCYYKLNKIPKAIINYEKALLLNPASEDTKYNLELANKLVVDKLNIIPIFFLTKWKNNFINFYSSDNWAIISISSFILTLILLLAFFSTRNMFIKKSSFFISVLAIIIALISIRASYIQKQKITANNSAIITDYSVTIKSSPDKKSTDLFQLHEGTKVYVLDSINVWFNIKLLDGSVGWIEKEKIEII